MEIRNNNDITFKAFYRNSPPCMQYLAKDFGNKIRFSKALEILDERCSKHKFFDMFYSPGNNSIKIFPKDRTIERVSPNVGRYISILENERYNLKTGADVYNKSQINQDSSFFKKILRMFSFKKAKKYIVMNPYDKLPSNVREAVDIIEKMEHSLLY